MGCMSHKCQNEVNSMKEMRCKKCGALIAKISDKNIIALKDDTTPSKGFILCDRDLEIMCFKWDGNKKCMTLNKIKI